MLSEVENIRLSIFKCPLIHGRGGGGEGHSSVSGSNDGEEDSQHDLEHDSRH